VFPILIITIFTLKALKIGVGLIDDSAEKDPMKSVPSWDGRDTIGSVPNLKGFHVRGEIQG
jgi:hypothetical protein